MSKQMIIALALLATGAAYAEGPIDWPPEQPFAATKTRAEVRAEMFAARASGETAAVTSEDSGATYLARLEPVIRLSRAQVVAEMFAARERGEIDAINGEDSGSTYLAKRAPLASDRDVLVAKLQREAN